MGYSHSKELWIPTFADKPNAEYLYFPGCKPSFSKEARESMNTFVKFLLDTNVDFAVIGEDQWCCGDHAYKLGYEDISNLIAKRNIAFWKELKVKKIITSCPQCFDTLQNKYRQLGGNFEIIPQSAFSYFSIEHFQSVKHTKPSLNIGSFLF
ncbi:heterodisulfide reductase-related iron-sulfur binding cluster [Desulfitobacterium sp. AusDCA]|uniref:heterodisulfide reductase-related iron-sulfur binding cluster n=1 Tax=Desulfitobacterium sp. AusDCA TaxID=3240383 RepID=UPI003DA7432D